MKIALRMAGILSWFNLVFWALILVICLLNTLTVFNVSLLGGVVLLCSIPLNSYAAIQLHRAIRHPEIKLSHHTPAGIRFVGMIAMFFGVLMVAYGVVILQDTGAVLKLLKEQLPDNKDLFEVVTVDYLRRVGVFALVLGVAVIVNVILNMRLLRWYYLVKQSDVS
jgi:hypothetical protein